MAGQNVTFDFLTRGADKTASDFKKTGDNAALAARGAKVLADAIDKLGSKEDRTAAESKILASALKQTGDAEDRLTAKTVIADAAIRKLDDEMKAAAKKREAELKVTVDDSALKKLQASSFFQPSAKGSLLSLIPAVIPLAGAAAGAVGAIGISFGAAAAGAGVFGLAATSVLSNVSTNLAKLQTLELTLNKATTPAAKKTAEAAIAALKSTWSAGYLTLINDYQGFQARWTKVSQAIAVPALTAWLPAVTKGLGFLIPAVTPVADLFKSWGVTLDRYFSNPAVAARINAMAAAFGKFSASQLSDVAKFVGDIAVGIFNLGRDLGASGANLGKAGTWLAGIGAGFVTWSASSKARGDVQGFLAYLHQEGPVVTGILRDLGKILPGIFKGASATGTLELKAIATFLGLIAGLPKGWQAPVTEAAGVLLLLAKTGVIKVGFTVIGAAVSWVKKLLGGASVDIGGTAAAAEIRAAMVSGGTAAAAEIRAAMAGGGAAAGAEGAAGGAAKGAGLGGVSAAAGATALGLATAGVFVGALIRGIGDKLSPTGTFAGSLNKMFQNLAGPVSGSVLHAFTFGGLEGWLTAKIGEPVGNVENNILAGSKIWGGNVTKTVTGSFSNIAGGAKTWWGNVTGTVAGAWNKITGNTQTSTAGVTRSSVNSWRQLNTDAATWWGRVATTIGGHMANAAGTVSTASGHIKTSILGVGVYANTQAGHVDQYNLALSRIPKNIHTNISATASGTGGIKITGTGTASGAGGIRLTNFAAGGKVTGGTPGRDSVLINAMPGEVVVPTGMVRAGAVDHLRGQLPGFASGGLVGLGGNVGALSPYASGRDNADAEKAIAAGIREAVAAAKASAFGSGQAIANYAMGFLGRIPYVWGGTAVPGGADCSGFTQSVYGHFGIRAPRTSEQQGAWVKRSPPTPGGLAFYHSPAGGPDPGHVAIVRSGSQVISQGGGLGPQLIGIHALPLLWTGVPPGGLPSGGGGGGSTAGRLSAATIARLWTSLGGPASAASNMAAIANAESSDIPSAVQTGEPPGLTGWGLYQITPTSGIRQNGAFGNLLNASNNTRAAISLFSQSGYQPWASDPVGRGLAAAPFGFDKGGWLMPGVTLAVNKTGRPEQVIPHGGGGAGGVHLHLTINGPVGSQQQLEDWFVRTANKASRTGRLTQAVKAASR